MIYFNVKKKSQLKTYKYGIENYSYRLVNRHKRYNDNAFQASGAFPSLLDGALGRTRRVSTEQDRNV